MATDFTIEPQWRGRFFAGARFLLFALMFLVLLTIGSWAIDGVKKSIRGFAWEESVGCLLALLSAILATFALALVEKRSFWDYGFGGPKRLKLLTLGSASGVLLISLVVLTLWHCGGLIFIDHLSSPTVALRNAFAYAVLFLAVGLSEEFLWRGYALVTLSKVISFWPAAVMLGILFGLSHVSTDNESRVAILSAMAIGVVFCYSFVRFRSLWFAVGVHASWDYGQSAIYGVPDSGVIVPGSLLAARITGPTWLTGGSAGPEGSVLIIIVITVLIVIVRKSAGAVPPTEPPPLPALPDSAPLIDAPALKD